MADTVLTLAADHPDDPCAAEPIRVPGLIQPHGVLLVVAPGGALRITAASVNAAVLLGRDPLGQPLAALLGEAVARELAERDLAADLSPCSAWETTIEPPGLPGPLELAAHRHDGRLLLELERAAADDAARALLAGRLLARWIGRLRDGGGLEALATLTCAGIRQISGYERVLVYRFDPDWHGQAIAEEKVPGWDQSFLGLHFPASDIPAQARELYRVSLMRWVPERDYVPVPLRELAVPGEGPRPPIDLSFARLRSLSPIHLQYHRNMGVNGTMSLSVLHEGKLWGLVVCHHRAPHRLSPGQRAAIAALTDAFALRLGPAGRADREQARRADMAQLERLLAHLAEATDLIAAVTSGPVTLDSLFGATGACAVHAGTVVAVGRTPPQADLVALTEWLRARPEPAVLHTDRLPDLYPAFLPHAAIASGLLAVFLSSDRDDMLLWFRPGEAQEVSWGGDPRKPVRTAGGSSPAPGPSAEGSAAPLPGPDAALLARQALLPRESFERWVEVRHGRARSWEEWELEMAGQLRHAIMEVVVRGLRRVAELNEQLRQSQKMEAVGQLTGGLAHDFNNLLTGITGSLELLQTRLSQGRLTELDRYVGAAQGACRRAAALTHRLLAFSRHQKLDPRPVDVNRLVAGMEELIRRTMRADIVVEVVAAGGLWNTRCDPNQLENALLNLCINARDAMPEGGRLTVETANRWLDARAARERDLPPGQYVSLCVSDSGMGMTQEVQSRAFDPFFTTKPLGQGTGLGLSMIYGFARQSGGQVRIYSDPGQGTSVCLYLPRHLGAAEEAQEGDELPPALRAQAGETVLVVDDEPTVRMLVTEVLEELGYQALEAADGAGGLRLLQSGRRIDLLVSDLGLPGGMSGRQLADAAREARPTLRVLFITAYAENAVTGHGHLEPGMQVLTKPFSMEMLASRIQEILGK